MAYDFEALRESLYARALERCTSCGEAEWVTLDMAVLLQHLDAEQRVKPGKGMPVLPVVCGACGYIRMHSIAVLEGRDIKLQTNH